MNRFVGYLSLLACSLIFLLFVLKYKVYAIENDLKKTNVRIKETQDSLRVLKAEFHFLNRPERIRDLAQKLTQLQPLSEKRLFTEKEIRFASPHSNGEKS